MKSWNHQPVDLLSFMFGSILLGGSQVPNLRRLPEPNPGPLCQATLRTSVFVCPTHPWRLWNAQRPDKNVSFIHISSLSPALKCLAILTLARSWSSLVKQFETCWNCVSLSLAEICRAFGLSLNLCHPELIQNGCPSGKCTIEAWIDTSNSMNHKPSAIFEISGQFIRVISITSNLFHCRVADFQNLLKEWKQRRHFLRQFVASPLTDQLLLCDELKK